VNINKILDQHDNWKFECFTCNKKFSVEIYENETTYGDKFRDVKEGTLFAHPDGSYSYYCKDCEQNINYN